jgi:RecT family
MQSLQLDPLNEEIGFIRYEDGSWQTFISIEGCAKLLNRHEQFNGLTFTQSETTIEGVPEWIECTIYRKDRSLPICIREHYAEVKGESPVWQKMPRRMLRHRALQQCIRLAF